MHFSPYAGAACAALFAAFFAAMTGLDPHAQVVIIFLPSVVLNIEKDPVEQPYFVAIHQLIFCNAHVRTSIFFLGG